MKIPQDYKKLYNDLSRFFKQKKITEDKIRSFGLNLISNNKHYKIRVGNTIIALCRSPSDYNSREHEIKLIVTAFMKEGIKWQ